MLINHLSILLIVPFAQNSNDVIAGLEWNIVMSTRVLYFAFLSNANLGIIGVNAHKHTAFNRVRRRVIARQHGI
jgi:hypothetical protein